jgi:hypothetical protein
MPAFYKVDDVPAHDSLLMPTREVTLGSPRGDIRLAFRQACSLIPSVAFNPIMRTGEWAFET